MTFRQQPEAHGNGNQFPAIDPQQTNTQNVRSTIMNAQSQQPYTQGGAQQQSYGQQPYGQAYVNGAQPYAAGTLDGMDTAAFTNAKRTSITRAYAEMTAGLLVTIVVAVISQTTGALTSFLSATGIIGLIGLLIAQVGMAVVLGWRIMKMQPATARALFYLYAALMGFTLSSIFFAYNIGSIAMALGITVGFFFVLTMLSLTTKFDMLKAGPILFAALLVLIVGEVIMMFIAPSNGTIMAISAIGLIIFAGYTAYDAQATRAMFNQYAGNPDMIVRLSIVCALNLYLDFVNMFLYILRLVGNNR